MRTPAPVSIYDSPTSDQPKADLKDAFDLTYTQKENEVWTAMFSLPPDDPHLDLIDGMDLAELYDNGERVELFQIIRKIPRRRQNTQDVHFQLRHVLDYLNRDLVGEEQVYDDSLERYRNVEKTGMETALNYVLDQQSVQRWELGDLDFSGSYTYEFFQEKLLNAVRKIPKPLWEDWQFEYDTTSYPWTLNIVSPDTTAEALIHYGKNMESIEQEIDWSKLVTKVYAFGSGSGEDQVTSGPFTSDPEGYGTIEGTFSEPYFTTESGLTTAAQNWLEKHNTPLVRYEGAAADYKVLEGTNELNVGEYVRVYDALLDIESKVRVVRLSKDNVGDGSPIRYELSNSFQRMPDFGALAYKESVTENELESNSVRGGGGGGALAGGSVGEREAKSTLSLEYLNDTGEWGTRITANENGISTNVTDIDSNSSSITQNADRIQLLVSDINGNNSEILQTANQISLNVENIDENYSQITVLDDEIGLKVEKDDVITQINISNELIRIEGERINLDGSVTFSNTYQVPSNLEAKDGTTIISGGQIYAESLSVEVVKLRDEVTGEVETLTGTLVADKTSSHTSEDTENVNDVPASTVESNASVGKSAWDEFQAGNWDFTVHLPTSFKGQGNLAVKNALDITDDSNLGGGALLSGVGQLAPKNEAKWSEDIVGYLMPEDQADVTAGQFGMSLSDIENGAGFGSDSWNSLGNNPYYDSQYDKIRWSSGGALLGELEPAEPGADVTGTNTSANSDKLAGKFPGDIDWPDLKLSETDVTKDHVGLNEVPNIDWQSSGWSDFLLKRSDVNEDHVGFSLSISNIESAYDTLNAGNWDWVSDMPTTFEGQGSLSLEESVSLGTQVTGEGAFAYEDSVSLADNFVTGEGQFAYESTLDLANDGYLLTSTVDTLAFLGSLDLKGYYADNAVKQANADETQREVQEFSITYGDSPETKVNKYDVQTDQGTIPAWLFTTKPSNAQAYVLGKDFS